MNAYYHKVIHKIKSQAGIILKSQSPDFIIIGAQKAATSSLHYLLDQHQNLIGSVPKELHFFNREIYFSKNIEWYESHFKSFRSSSMLFFESTPAYIYHPDTAKLIKEYYPSIKLIILLRDPIKRAYSAWNHYKDIFEKGLGEKQIGSKPRINNNRLYDYFFYKRNKFPSFGECLEIELYIMKNNEKIYEPSLLRRGLYYDQLQSYWRYFAKKNILILGFSEFINNHEKTLKMVTNFLGVQRMNWDKIDNSPKNKREYKKPISTEEIKFLEQFYSIPNKRLFEEIGVIPW